MSQSKITRKPLPIVDPIFAAIAERKAREKEFYRLDRALGAATSKAQKEHGEPPRYCGALLRLPGADPEQIDEEYRDAKARLVEWERRAGIAPLREQLENADFARLCEWPGPSQRRQPARAPWSSMCGATSQSARLI